MQKFICLAASKTRPAKVLLRITIATYQYPLLGSTPLEVGQYQLTSLHDCRPVASVCSWIGTTLVIRMVHGWAGSTIRALQLFRVSCKARGGSPRSCEAGRLVSVIRQVHWSCSRMGCFLGGLPGWAWPVGSIPACGGSLLEWEAVGEALQSGRHWLGSTLETVF